MIFFDKTKKNMYNFENQKESIRISKKLEPSVGIMNGSTSRLLPNCQEFVFFLLGHETLPCLGAKNKLTVFFVITMRIQNQDVTQYYLNSAILNYFF